MQQTTLLDKTDQKLDSLLVLAARLWRSREGSLDTDPGGDAAGSRRSADTDSKAILLLVYGTVDMKILSNGQMSYLSMPHQQYSCD